MLHGGFHGRTYGALSATFQESKQAPFAPLVPGFVPVAARRRRRSTPPSHDGPRPCCSSRSRARRASTCSPTSCCARRARRATAIGAALVFDEVQTGHGADGHAVGVRGDAGVVPDAITVAKALAGGLPDRRADHRRAARRRARARRPRLDVRGRPGDRRRPRTRRSTCCDDPALLARVRELGTRLQESLRELPGVRRVRGRGLMVAADIDRSAPDVVRRALLEQRLVINATGPQTLRFLPPLVIGERRRRRRGRAPGAAALLAVDPERVVPGGRGAVAVGAGRSRTAGSEQPARAACLHISVDIDAYVQTR